MIPILLFLAMPSLASALENSSSISSLKGDATSAPIKEEKAQSIPGDQVIPHIDHEVIDKSLERARKAWKDEQTRMESSLPEDENISLEIERKKSEEKPKKVAGEATAKKKKTYWKPKIHKPIVIEQPTGRTITIFHNHLANDEETITLPSGAHAFGRVKFGEEVTTQGEAEVLLEFDYAFLGPNESVVEMTGCVAWLQVHANFHTQRVKGKMQDMTCTMKNGDVFTIPLTGPIVDVATGYAGVNSDLIIKGPAKAMALKFLSEITTAYGAASSAVETTTKIIASGEKQTDQTTNITGDKEGYVGGKIVEANGKFLDYIASFFSGMQPTLALAPGAKVHVVNRHNVRIPKQFFKPSKGSK